MDEVSWLRHCQGAPVGAEPEGTDGAHGALEGGQALVQPPQVPDPRGGVLQERRLVLRVLLALRRAPETHRHAQIPLMDCPCRADMPAVQLSLPVADTV